MTSCLIWCQDSGRPTFQVYEAVFLWLEWSRLHRSHGLAGRGACSPGEPGPLGGAEQGLCAGWIGWLDPQCLVLSAGELRLTSRTFPCLVLSRRGAWVNEQNVPVFCPESGELGWGAELSHHTFFPFITSPPPVGSALMESSRWKEMADLPTITAK